MENSIIKTRTRREVRSSKPKTSGKMITDEDICRRAYEIYLENGDDYSDDLDNWLNAERE